VVLPQATRTLVSDAVSRTPAVATWTAIAAVASFRQRLRAAEMARALTFGPSSRVPAGGFQRLVVRPRVRSASRLERRMPSG